MQYPKITFDSETNYEEVELIVKSMYDCVLSQGDVCCKSRSVSDMLCEADVKRRAMSINKGFGNTDRYQQNVKDLYNLLYNSATCYDGTFPVLPIKIATWLSAFSSALEVSIDGGDFLPMDSSGIFQYNSEYEVRGITSIAPIAFSRFQFVQDSVNAYTDDFRFIVNSSHPFYNNPSEINIITANYQTVDYTLNGIGGTLGASLSVYVNGSIAPALTNAGCPYDIDGQSCYIYNGDTLGIQIQQASQNQVSSASIKSNGIAYTMDSQQPLESGSYRRYIFVPLSSSIVLTEFVIN